MQSYKNVVASKCPETLEIGVYQGGGKKERAGRRTENDIRLHPIPVADGGKPSGAADGWKHKALLTPEGYSIELVLPKAAIEAMDIKLNAGERLRIGVFGGGYDKYWGEPAWINWIDSSDETDFHVAESF